MTEIRRKLRTIPELTEAIEDLWNRQDRGTLDAKTADAMNTTLKSAMLLNVSLPMQAYKLFVQAAIKKVKIPRGLKAALPISIAEEDDVAPPSA